MLVLEIEYLNRVSYAATFNRADESEWPPHPDRVFMALVDAWGTSGRDPSGADALEWLESQDLPEIAAPKAHSRGRFRNFVPTSGNRANGFGYLNDNNILEIVPSIVRKERSFPASVLPDDRPTVHMIWRGAEPSDAVLDALSALARRVPRIGHSASLTRVAVRGTTDLEASHVADESGQDLLRCPRPGRFAALVSEFESASDSLVPAWPSTAQTFRYNRPAATAADESVMGGASEWIVLSAHGDYVPVLEAFPVVAKAMRDAVMSHASQPVHEAISGHGADGSALKGPHLAILPMANVGWRGGHSDGSLMGMALVLPKSSAYGTDERRQLRQSVARFLDTEHGGGRLQMGKYGVMSLRRGGGGKKSLSPDRYTAEGRTWASVTPVVLDHHPKKRHGPEEIVADGCTRAGLPRPSSVSTSRHSPVHGAPSAFVARGRNKGWLPPKRGLFDNSFVCHAVVTFDRAVAGPVIVGAARYYGMGLFMPVGGAAP